MNRSDTAKDTHRNEKKTSGHEAHKPAGANRTEPTSTSSQGGDARASTGAQGDQSRRTNKERDSLPVERAENEGMDAKPQATQQQPASRSTEKSGAPDGSKGTSDDSKVEGEGSYSATRRYNDGVARSVEKGDAEKLGRDAAAALDGPEGADLRKAESTAKHAHKN